jgi:formamidase
MKGVIVAERQEIERVSLRDRFLGLPRILCEPGVALNEQAHIGHNRWHPEIKPKLYIKPGEEVVLEAIDPFDGQITHHGDCDELCRLDTSHCHPLTGPVYVDGAEPGDLLDVEILGVEPLSGRAFSNIFPDLPGGLGDRFPRGFRTTWYARGSIAESPQLPGIRIPIQPHPGTIGVAPSYELLESWEAREREIRASGMVWEHSLRNAIIDGVPDPLRSMPARTQPPRENGGNMDINKLGAGSRVYFPVFVRGGLLSLGDHHLSAGDGECSYNAMEMDGRSWLRINVVKDGVRKYNVKTPIVRPGPLGWTPSRERFLGFTGFSFSATEQGFQDVTLASKEALLRAVDYLCARGYSAEQAYTIISVAPTEYRISCVVTPPNVSVTLYVPLDVFDRDISRL